MTAPSGPDAYATFAGLLSALDHEVDDEDVWVTLVEYAEEFLSRDAEVFALDWTVEEHGEGVVLATPEVQMHTLEPPYTVADWHAYLAELDCRVGRAAAIAEIPTPDELGDVEEARSATLASLAGVLGVTVDALVLELGDDWTVIEEHAVGTHTHPDRYLLWRGELVVGIDDEYVHVFSVRAEHGAACADEVVGWLGWPELKVTLDFAVFVPELRNALVEQERRHREQTVLAHSGLCREVERTLRDRGLEVEEYEPGRFTFEVEGFDFVVLATEELHPVVRFQHLVAEVEESERPAALQLANALLRRTSTTGAFWSLGDRYLWQESMLWARRFDTGNFGEHLTAFVAIAMDRTPEIRVRLGGEWPARPSA